jgi:hypothetical protein
MLSDGIVWSFLICGAVALLFTLFRPERKPEDRFKVVDTYKNCNVIRYTDPSNNWHYFFRCGT